MNPGEFASLSEKFLIQVQRSPHSRWAHMHQYTSLMQMLQPGCPPEAARLCTEGRFYRTAIVIRGWLCPAPICTTTGTRFPGITPLGTSALICVRPATD